MNHTGKQRGHVVIAGGSGFLGRGLIGELTDRYDRIVVLTRGSDRQDGPVRYVHWDARDVGEWATHLDGAAAVINLVGRSVDCRKTPENKRIILESRVDSVRALAGAWRQCANPPRVWVQSATAHIYGDTTDEVLDESSPIGEGFAPQVGTAWEAALSDEALPGCRKVLLRISFVLGRNGGPLRTLTKLARLFLGGTVGSGKQYISWIHVADLNAIILRALNDDSMQGVYVVTAPNPVTNREFMKALRSAVGRPWSPPAPGMGVRVAAWLMRSDPELALLGRRCVPTRLMNEGFTFRFPHVGDAVNDLLGD